MCCKDIKPKNNDKPYAFLEPYSGYNYGRQKEKYCLSKNMYWNRDFWDQMYGY